MSENRYNREREQELTECRKCETTFDLTEQYYYSDLCRSCYEQENEEWRTWPICVACSARIDSDDAGRATSRSYNGAERVTVCSEGCKEHVEHSPQAPWGSSLDKGENPYGERVPAPDQEFHE